MPRAEIFVTGKVWNDCQGFERCIQSCENAARSGLHYFDLLLVHWPLPVTFERRIERWSICTERVECVHWGSPTLL